MTLGCTEILANIYISALENLYFICTCTLFKGTPHVRVNFYWLYFIFETLVQKRGFLPPKNHWAGKQNQNFPSCTLIS